jgi:hypothetical protein
VIDNDLATGCLELTDVDVHITGAPKSVQKGLDPVDGWSGGGDAVIRIRIAVYIHQSLSATLATAIPVRVPWTITIVVFDQLLGNNRLRKSA